MITRGLQVQTPHPQTRIKTVLERAALVVNPACGRQALQQRSARLRRVPRWVAVGRRDDYNDYYDYVGVRCGMGKTWTVAEAKAKFSEVLEKAEKEGPQRITRRGEETAVVVSKKEWERRTKRKGTLLEFFANSPLRGSGIKIERMKDTTDPVEL